jgi:3'(2'), 5'-bisphosphate nucleotidase
MESFLDIAKKAAYVAGVEVMKLYEDSDFKTKSDGSPVTQADIRANEVIFSHLEKTGLPILSEESDGITLPYPEQLWIIDPIDGTRGFLNKDGEFAVMIALLVNGKPEVSVMYAPTQETLYYAQKGTGAFKETYGEVVRLTTQPNPNSPLCCIYSRNHFSPIMESIAHSLDATNISCGGMGIKATLVATNEADFFFTQGKLGEWDVCAPALFVEEAGGIVTNIYGKELVYGTHNHRLEHGVLFSNGKNFDAITQAIAQHL